jgi:hypothetical protein
MTAPELRPSDLEGARNGALRSTTNRLHSLQVRIPISNSSRRTIAPQLFEVRSDDGPQENR